MKKEKKREMKSFKMEKKEDFIIYLCDLITRTTILLEYHERDLKRLQNFISKLVSNGLISTDYEEYRMFVHLITHGESYLLNLIGDNQKTSISYLKFREFVKKRKNRGTLGFEMPDLESETNEMLKYLNRARNWQNHVPESLLTSELKLRDYGKIINTGTEPITIYFPSKCSINMIIDLYRCSLENHEMFNKALESMKKDYSILIGKEVKIKKEIVVEPYDLQNLEGVKIAASIQGL